MPGGDVYVIAIIVVLAIVALELVRHMIGPSAPGDHLKKEACPTGQPKAKVAPQWGSVIRFRQKRGLSEGSPR